MNRHAKAASAGSTSGRGKRHARITAAFACVSFLLAFAGSSASPALAVVPPKGVTGFFGATGTAAGQLNTPRGVALNQSNGDVYAVDGTNNRVVVYDSNGKFLRAFGADVVAYGPGQSNEIQLVDVAATSGNFKLAFGSATTPNLAATASAATVQAALNGLETISAGAGSVTVSGGPGDATGSSPYRITFNGGPLAATNVAQIAVVSEGLSGGSPASAITAGTASPGQVGFEVCVPANGDACKAGTFLNGGLIWGEMNSQGIAINQSSGDLYVTDQGNRRVQQFDSSGNFIRAFGKDVVVTGFPGNRPEASAVQTVTVTATEGKYKLKFGGSETAELAFNATAAEIQGALQGLASIGTGNATVSETSAGVFKVTFAGALANNPEPLIATESGPGEPLVGGAATVVNTTTGSTGYEICVAANGDVCKAGPEGAQGTTGGAFASNAFGTELGQLAVAPVGAPNAGNLLVADPTNRRVQEFGPTGDFIRAFGFDVVKAGPGQAGTGFETCVPASGDACQAGAAGSGAGQFATATPTRIAEDAAGNIYTVEPTTNFRVQKFTLPSNVVTPQGTFAEADLKGTAASSAPTNIAVNPATNNVLVSKAFPAGSTPSCPITGTPSAAESRVVEASSAGALEGTHGVCAGITPANGLALHGSSGNLYVSSTLNASRLYVLNTGQPVAPTLLITNVSGVGAHSATINGLIGPNGPELPYGTESTYAIEYKRSVDAGFTKLSNSEATAGNRTTTKAITVALGGLRPGTSYDVRLTATKPFGSGSASQTVSFATTASAPDVALPQFARVSETAVRLAGWVNPNNQATAYRFEYVGQAGFEATGFAGATQVPASDVDLGSGAVPASASQVISGLTPGATYHYRLLAANPSGLRSANGTFTTPDASSCSNAGLRGEQASTANPAGSTYLPNCMALEMVTPPKKYNQGVTVPGLSNSGEAVRFTSEAALVETPQQGGLVDRYVAARTPSGWVSHATRTPVDLGRAFFFGGQPCTFSTDLSHWTLIALPEPWMAGRLRPSRGGFGSSFSPLGPVMSPQRLSGLTADGANCHGGSSDASRVFFGTAGNTFLPGDPPFSGNPFSIPVSESVYEAYRDENGEPTVELLVRDANGTVYGGGCGSTVGWRTGGGPFTRGAISADGTRVYFTTRPTQGSGSCNTTANFNRVMKRVQTPSGPQISLVSASECARLSPACDASDGDDRFWGASLEGDKVFFTSTRQLANSDIDTGSICGSTVAGSSAGCDLYLYDAARPAGSRLTQVSAGDATAPTPGKGAEVLGMVALAGDGSHAYFVAKGVLSTSPNTLGRTAEPGKANLYLYERDASHPGGHLSFVAALDSTDALWQNGFSPSGAFAVPALGSDVEDVSVGGDGHILALITKVALTPDDTDGNKKDFYRYDSDSGTFERISVAAPGGADNGALDAVQAVGNGGYAPPSPNDLSFRRWVSDDGGTMVFSTAEPLDPNDTDGKATSYIWHEGDVTAIRSSLSGAGVQEAPTVSISGEVVAFVSGTSLLPEDGDGSRDIYVARSEGGYPLPVDPAPCKGEACQESFGDQPEGEGPASESFTGPGNLKSQPTPPTCPKGKRKVRRNGKVRCAPPKGKRKAKQAQRVRHANVNRRAGK